MMASQNIVTFYFVLTLFSFIFVVIAGLIFLFHFFAERLPVSRWQRDLVDSTLFRNLGIAQAYSLLAYETLLSGLNKLQINEEKISDDLEAHWEVLTEAVQTVMRRYRLKQPYQQLKMLS